jgi:hypothetical protein
VVQVAHRSMCRRARLRSAGVSCPALPQLQLEDLALGGVQAARGGGEQGAQFGPFGRSLGDVDDGVRHPGGTVIRGAGRGDLRICRHSLRATAYSQARSRSGSRSSASRHEAMTNVSWTASAASGGLRRRADC